MSELSEHEVLCRARNGIEQGGYDYGDYGLGPNGGCGTPRCVLGWVGWEAGIRYPKDWDSRPAIYKESARPYVEALSALWDARPTVPYPDLAHAREPIARLVELVALAVTYPEDHRPLQNPPSDEEVAEVILAWFARAISATAPSPDFSSLELEAVS